MEIRKIEETKEYLLVKGKAKIRLNREEAESLKDVLTSAKLVPITELAGYELIAVDGGRIFLTVEEVEELKRKLLVPYRPRISAEFREKILSVVPRAVSNAASVSEIMKKVNAKRSQVSSALKQLRESGQVKSIRKGHMYLYFIPVAKVEKTDDVEKVAVGVTDPLKDEARIQRELKKNV